LLGDGVRSSAHVRPRRDAVGDGVPDLTLKVRRDFPAPRLRAYPRETVVAEKLEAMVQLGMANRPFHDFLAVRLRA
jgi:hypothetical protein